MDVYAAGTMEDLRYSLRRSWNFVLPSEITELARDVESGTFSLTVNINPNGPDQKPECNTCYDDNTANLYSNRFEHVGLGGDQALTLKPYFVEARVFKDDGTTLFMPRPTCCQARRCDPLHAAGDAGGRRSARHQIEDLAQRRLVGHRRRRRRCPGPFSHQELPAERRAAGCPSQ